MKLLAGAMFVVMLALAGCGSPNKANIALRKQIAEQERSIKDLAARLEGSEASLRMLETKNGPPTTRLAYDQLKQLVTVSSIQLGRLTGGVDKDPKKPGDELFAVYLEPLDHTGDIFKAAGSVTVELFDLSQSGKTVGRWEFTSEQVVQSWIGVMLVYDFVLECPWQGEVPTSEKLTTRVVFTETLTGRSFETTKEVRVKPPR